MDFVVFNHDNKNKWIPRQQRAKPYSKVVSIK